MSGSRLYHHEVAKRLDNVVVVTRHEEEHPREAEAEWDRTEGIRIQRRWGINRKFFQWLPRNRATSWVTIVLPGIATMSLWSLAASIRFRPATIHAGPSFAAGLAARFLARLHGVPYILYEHGEDILDLGNRGERMRALRREIYTGAAAVVCNAKNTVELVKEMGVSPERIVLAYPGVDVRRFVGLQHRADGEGADWAPVLLTVGYLIKQKGQAITIRTLPRLVKEWPRLRYLIIGDGPEQSRLEALATELGVRSNVTFLGRVPEAELLEAFSATDVYVQPSLIDDGVTEGYGISFLEAGAAGIPVVGGRCGGVVEAVVEGVTGLLVNPGDVDDCYAAVSRLLRDEALRRRLGEAGRRLAEERTWDKTLAPVIALDRRLRANP
jgi:phosphatidylinositol alpha-1,6-mannosyltransferase